MMNKAILIFYLLVCKFLPVQAQNWQTFGGNSSRNGMSRITGPQSVTTPAWQIQSSLNTTLGMAIYSFGDRFVTSRAVFSPYTSRIECRNIINGALEWTSPFISSSSILYAIGMTEDAVYAHDYNTDSIYALNLQDGSIKWRSPVRSQTFGAYPGCVFACNGDPILNAPLSSGKFTMRLDRNSGDTLWTNSELIAIGPAVALAASPSTVYRLTGGITLPIRLTAIDINTGQTKYSSAPVPGDPDQEDPLIIGPGNMIYFWRDGGNLFAYRDNGTSLVQEWMYVPASVGTVPLTRNISLGPGGSLYIFENTGVKRINTQNGLVLDSIPLNIGSSSSITVGHDSTVYINNGLSMLYAFSADLQVLKWQRSIPSATYVNPPLCYEGTMVLTQAGFTMTAFRDSLPLAPVADFRCSSRKVVTSQPVDFFDQSSFAPSSWQWLFPGSVQGSSAQQNPNGIVYTIPGIYEVTLSVQNQHGSDTLTKKCYLEVVQASAVQELRPEEVLLFPNPAVDVVHVSIPPEGADVAFDLADMQGRTVLSSAFRPGSNTLDIRHLEKGIYLFRWRHTGIPPSRFVKQ